MIVRPAQPYLDWASSLEGFSDLRVPSGDEPVYLLPEFDTFEEAEDMLRRIWPLIFESELSAWCTDESLWPQDRSWETFRAWFTVELHSVVEDLPGGPIFEDEEPLDDDA
jgi:hypothetical protein